MPARPTPPGSAKPWPSARFCACGVPAPRTSFVELTLSVPGKYDHELVGLYTLIEQVDKGFLKDRFGEGGGLLMKPERLNDFAYLGDDWNRYAGQYQPKQNPSRKQSKRVIDWTWLVDKADDEKFQAEIGDYLNVDEFLRYLAVGPGWPTWTVCSPSATTTTSISTLAPTSSTSCLGTSTCRSPASRWQARPTIC